MRFGFATPELLYPIALLAVALSLSFPVLAAMRSGRLPPALGAALVVAIGLAFFTPYLLAGREGRRRMKELENRDGASPDTPEP